MLSGGEGRCKQDQDMHKIYQEKEGNVVGKIVRQQTKWAGRVLPLMKHSVIKVLDKKSDTHFLQIVLEHMDTKPHFKIRDHVVLSIADLAQVDPSMHQYIFASLMVAKLVAGEDGSYGLVLLGCKNIRNMPLLIRTLHAPCIFDFSNSQPIDEVVQLINQGHI